MATCDGAAFSTTGTMPSQTELVLPAGTYIAFARNQSHQGEREFTPQAGRDQSLSIVAGN